MSESGKAVKGVEYDTKHIEECAPLPKGYIDMFRNYMTHEIRASFASYPSVKELASAHNSNEAQH